ncbi:MAG: type II toxin-antitoxin system ParD family antitoxin [Spirochaetaceae bacterium]|nr:type II toxin-antitoxin system ParD family antitoxin [Spirochaetaceae bacterium]
MLVAVKSSISLTDEQHAFARALVEAGRYSSLSAVLQQGVDLLRQRVDAEELETEALRELLSRRRNGERISAERMDTRLGSMIADKRRAHGLPS